MNRLLSHCFRHSSRPLFVAAAPIAAHAGTNIPPAPGLRSSVFTQATGCPGRGVRKRSPTTLYGTKHAQTVLASHYTYKPLVGTWVIFSKGESLNSLSPTPMDSRRGQPDALSFKLPAPATCLELVAVARGFGHAVTFPIGFLNGFG